MRKVSIPLNKISSQDINLAKNPKAMEEVTAILKLSQEERNARLSEISQRITQGTATLYEEKVLAKLLSPGQAEWIYLLNKNLSKIEAQGTGLEEEKPSSSEDELKQEERTPTSSSTQTEEPPDRVSRTIFSNRSLEKEQSDLKILPSPSEIGSYMKGFLTGVIGAGLLILGIWKTFNSPESSKFEVTFSSRSSSTPSLPADTLQVLQTQLEKGQQEIRMGNFNRGESELKEIMVKYPETSQAEEAYLTLAEAYRYRSQKPDQALQLYQAFLEKYPHSSRTGLVLLKMGFCYEDMEDRGNAVAMYQSVIQRNGEKSRLGQLAAERLKTLTKE
ncbi:MAG TPA: tetratricopeptide repeat protein [Candidatus Limnocylindrales bacterium]|nr:tetratricopeptide repeat protein [Candidatus Limnocylindrales bacterium]